MLAVIIANSMTATHIHERETVMLCWAKSGLGIIFKALAFISFHFLAMF